MPTVSTGSGVTPGVGVRPSRARAGPARSPAPRPSRARRGQTRCSPPRSGAGVNLSVSCGQCRLPMTVIARPELRAARVLVLDRRQSPDPPGCGGHPAVIKRGDDAIARADLLDRHQHTQSRRPRMVPVTLHGQIPVARRGQGRRAARQARRRSVPRSRPGRLLSTPAAAPARRPAPSGSQRRPARRSAGKAMRTHCGAGLRLKRQRRAEVRAPCVITCLCAVCQPAQPAHQRLQTPQM